MDLKFEIDLSSERHDWMDCYLTFEGERHQLVSSTVFPPFPQLLGMIRAIATQRLPYCFYWDEEGKGTTFEALPLAPDHPQFRLFLKHDTRPFNIDVELDRQEVVNAFLQPLWDYVRNASPVSKTDWCLSLSDLQTFEKSQKSGIALRSDINIAQPAHFSLVRVKGDFESPVQWMNLYSLELLQPMVFVLHDLDQFWHDWIAFLEKVLNNQIPAEVKYVNTDWLSSVQEDIISGERIPTNSIKDIGYFLHAKPLPHPDNFRLQILDTDFYRTNYLFFDEVLNRRQFVSEFCDAFEDFLETTYKVCYDENGKVFDLRTLPISRLRSQE